MASVWLGGIGRPHQQGGIGPSPARRGLGPHQQGEIGPSPPARRDWALTSKEGIGPSTARRGLDLHLQILSVLVENTLRHAWLAHLINH